MIDPKAVTNYHRSLMELLEFAIFAVCVAGKNSDQTANKVNALWADSSFQATLSSQFDRPPTNEKEYAVHISFIRRHLEQHKIGQYERLSRIIFVLNQFSECLRRILFNDLVNFKGIGPKTAAFFLMHSRADFGIPVIDTHICKYMATKGVDMKVTSSLLKYLSNAEVVKHFIQQDFPKMTLAEADLYLWIQYSGRGDKRPQ